jgi:hypothetical protein
LDAELEQQIRAFAIGRIGLGAAALIAPGVVCKRWLGRGHDAVGSRALTRFVGGRDLALGLGTLFALGHGTPVRGWLEAGMVADAGDLFGTLLAAKHLPKVSAVGTSFAAAGGIAYARRLVSQLESSPPAGPPPSSPQLQPVS